MEDGLLERARDLAAIARIAAAACRGEGAALLIEGEAGIGKTSLLESTAAHPAGMRVLAARGGDQERELVFGIARQLLERELGDHAVRENLFGGDEFAAIHRLYWKVADLAECVPLALRVDDAHWADAASLRWLVYLARRVPALPVLLLVTARTDEAGAAHDLLAELRSSPGVIRILPAPLSSPATVEAVRSTVGAQADPVFCEACYTATAGNPLLLRELLRTVRSEQLAATAENAERVAEVGARGTPEHLLRRISRLGDDAVAVARAVAIVEPHADVAVVAEVAGIDPTRVATAAAALVRIGLLADASPLRFSHPVLREAVSAHAGEPERQRLHARAAEAHASRGAPPEISAAHLLKTDVAVGTWVVRVLDDAAEAALATAGPAQAARFLARATRERLDHDQRAALLRRRGRALILAGDESGIDELRRVREDSNDAVVRAQCTGDMLVALGVRGRIDEVLAMFAESAAEIDPLRNPDVHLMVVAGPIGAAMYADVDDLRGQVARARELLRSATGDSIPLRLLRQSVAWWLAPAGIGTVRDAAELAEQAIGGEDALARSAAAGSPLVPSITVLGEAGESERALRYLEISAAVMRRRGTTFGAFLALHARAMIQLSRGLLVEAEEDIAQAVGLARQTGVPLAETASGAVIAAIARDRTGPGGPNTRVPGTSGTTTFDLAATAEQALLELDRGRAEDGCRLLTQASRARDGIGGKTASLLPVRLHLPLALRANTRHDEASVVAAENLEFAERAQHPRWIGIAQWQMGLADPAGGVDALRAAADTLAGTDANLDHARTLIDLGAALRRRKHRRESREPLRAGMDLAQRLGATTLAERAREELAATGARPRSTTLSGIDALTASERRVARLAGEGMSNREIAEALFVSRKTVETHLAHVYQKLDVRSREALPAALIRPS